jgi:hypothetical protein
MKQRHTHIRQFAPNAEGVTIIEFAIVAPVFFLLLLGIIEFGLIGLHSVALDAAVAQTSRQASIGNVPPQYPDRVAYITDELQRRTDGLINSDQIVISANLVSAGGAPTPPDICLTDPPTVGGVCPSGTPFEEVNGIPGYQGAASPVTLGAAGDVVAVQAVLPWRVQIPFMGQFFGENGTLLLRSSTVVKNEPF